MRHAIYSRHLVVIALCECVMRCCDGGRQRDLAVMIAVVELVIDAGA